MSASPFHAYAHKRFREVFGPPDNSLGRDDHWRLKPRPGGASINILINGTYEVPAVWIFDPNDHNDGVSNRELRHEADVEALIGDIQDRLRRAGSKVDVR